MNNYRLTLFITGRSPQGDRAIANLRRICEHELKGRYEMEVIDVLEDPDAAERERIVAVPALIKQIPPPLRRIIGDLSNTDQVLLGLDLTPGPGQDTSGD